MIPHRRPVALLAVALALVLPASATAEPSRVPVERPGSVALGLPLAAPLDRDPRCALASEPARWTAALRAALRANRQRPADWTVLDPADRRALDRLGALARTDLADRTVTLSPLVPCWLLPTVVAHESAHLAQAARGLTQAAYDRDPLRWERAADRAVRSGWTSPVPPVTPYLWPVPPPLR